MYIAIDGGGTKTEYMLINDMGEEVACYIGNGTNHDFYQENWDGVRIELGRAIRELLAGSVIDGTVEGDECDTSEWFLANADLIKNFRIFAGMSGADTSDDLVNLRNCYEKLGFHSPQVINDGFLPLFSETDDGVGIAYNCGTGVCCAGRDFHGNMVKTAGMDEWSGDAGGGNWIIVETYRRAYREMVLVGSPQMDHGRRTWARRYMDVFSLKNEEELIDFWSVIKDPANTMERKMAVQMFFSAYEEGLDQAVEMAELMQDCLIENVMAAVNRLDFPACVRERKCIPVILSGSILTKAAPAVYIQDTERKLNEAAPGGICFALQCAKKKPVCGAVSWAVSR